MWLRFIVFILAGVICGCSSAPVFQKKTTGMGYVVKDLSQKGHFEVTLDLPTDIPEDFIFIYGMRAIGEECLLRGYDFFDTAEITEFKREAFCYSENVRTALGVTFKGPGLKKQPAEFVVENLNGKNPTKLAVKDQLISLNGTVLTSMAQLKGIVFQQPSRKISLSVEFSRDGKKMTAEEPLVNLRDSMFGKKDLDDFRKEIR